MERNKVHHMNWLDNTLPDKSVQLIIADPPYFEVKGEFDFIWESFDAYLKDVENWAAECARLLADNGSLFWWGDAKKIAYSQVILDKHLNILNSLVWEKIACRGRSMSAPAMRSFAPVTERLLFYDKGEIVSGMDMVHAEDEHFKELKKYLDEEFEKSGMTLKEVCSKFGSTCSHYFGFSKKHKTQFEIPTKEKYELLQSTGYFSRQFEDLRQEYDALKTEYMKKMRVFNMRKLWTDVLLFDQEANITGKYDHDTKKPEKLTRLLIDMTTNKGDLVLVPFAGSGTECAMAAREGREFIGFDIEAKYVDMANKRAQRELSTPTLF